MVQQSFKESIASKKFWFAIIAVLFSLGFAFLAAIKFAEMKSMYESFNGLVEFVVATYVGGNVLNKYIVGKAAAAQTPPADPPKDPKQP